MHHVEPVDCKAKPAVFFDGSCPMCRREIAFYQRQRGADGIDWIDASACQTADLPDSLGRETLMARLHVRTRDGQFVTGASAFATLWQALPRFSLAGRFAGLPGIRHVLEGAYVAFLPVRPWLQSLMRRRQG